MFERFTDRSRRVVELSQGEARLLNHSKIGTAHILLALLREGESGAWTALNESGVTLDRARSALIRIVGYGSHSTVGYQRFSPHGKKVLELTLRKALELGHEYMAPEHILLALLDFVRAWKKTYAELPVAGLVLSELGVDLTRLEKRAVELLNERQEQRPADSIYNSEARVDSSVKSKYGSGQ